MTQEKTIKTLSLLALMVVTIFSASNVFAQSSNEVINEAVDAQGEPTMIKENISVNKRVDTDKVEEEIVNKETEIQDKSIDGDNIENEMQAEENNSEIKDNDKRESGDNYRDSEDADDEDRGDRYEHRGDKENDEEEQLLVALASAFGGLLLGFSIAKYRTIISLIKK